MSSFHIATTTVPWVPADHTLELALSRELPGDGRVSSAFAFVLDAAGKTLMTCVDRPGRGWDVPGGHLEAGESAVAAAARELYEETGFSVESLGLFGWQRIEITGSVPASYPYPALSYMVMFTARLPYDGPTTAPPAGTECTHAAWLTPDEVESRCGHRVWMPLYRTLLT